MNRSWTKEANAHVDLGFARFDRRTPLPVLPHGFAVLLVEMTARQAASPTAAVFAREARVPHGPLLFAPADGAFNGEVARAMRQWQDE